MPSGLLRLWFSPLAVALSLLLPANLGAQALEIHFLDVGQGDAILLKSGERAALLDAGPTDEVVAQIRALGVRSLDLAIASHNHADHIGGMDAVLEEMPVRFYLDNGHAATTAIQRRVLNLVERKKVQYLRATPRTITLGSARLHILPSPMQGLEEEEQNNRSIVVLVEQGKFRALFTGDSEVEEIGSLLASRRIPDVDVLKAAHHGSHNGVTGPWMSQTRPEVVVISLGAGNSYGHPHGQAMRHYQGPGRRVLRTDQEGRVTVRVDATGNYRVETAGRRASPPGRRR